MDPIPGSKEAHDHGKPQSAIEEALDRTVSALKSAQHDYQSLPLLSLRKRFYMQGVIKTLTLLANLQHDLFHKYENQRGQWN